MNSSRVPGPLSNAPRSNTLAPKPPPPRSPRELAVEASQDRHRSPTRTGGVG